MRHSRSECATAVVALAMLGCGSEVVVGFERRGTPPLPESGDGPAEYSCGRGTLAQMGLNTPLCPELSWVRRLGKGHCTGATRAGDEVQLVANAPDASIYVWLPRVDDEGKVTTSLSFGAPGTRPGRGVHVGPDGRMWVAFHYTQPTLLDDVQLAPLGEPETSALAVFGPSGELENVAVIGVSNNADDPAIVTLGDGVLFAGLLDGAAAFGGEAKLGSLDAFVAAFGSDVSAGWSRRLGGPGVDLATSLSVLPDGSIVVGGATTVPEEGQTEMAAPLLVRIDGAGEIVWQLPYGTHPLHMVDDIATLPNGDIVLAGRRLKQVTDSGLQPGSAVVAALDLQGNVVWSRAFGLSTELYSPAQVEVLADGTIGVVVALSTEPCDPPDVQDGRLRAVAQPVVLVLDPDGSLMCAREWANHAYTTGIVTTAAQDGFIFAGSSWGPTFADEAPSDPEVFAARLDLH